MMSGRSSRYPFTASQWQELEHQALIFKYMASGMPIPHDLLLPIKRSFYFDSPSSSPYPSGGWGYFQIGFGSKAEDPEPWRCRRTDGKKWRCSKEAYPDSKYCERHMHRGKNRSRKPVEMPMPTTNSTAPATAAALNPSLYRPHLSIASVPEGHYPEPYGVSRNAAGLGVPIHGNVSHSFNMDTASSAFKYSSHAPKEEAPDQYTTSMSDSYGSGRERFWQFTPLGMTSQVGGERRYGSCTSLQDQSSWFFPQSELQDQKQEKRQHCFVLGADVEPENPSTAAEGEGEASRRPLLHFMDDWPLRASREPWMDAGEEQSTAWGGFAKTQLSISMAQHEFPTASSGSAGAGN